jgi:hypothetical protein
MGQMGPEKQAIPCVYALLPDKETNTYNKDVDDHLLSGQVRGWPALEDHDRLREGCHEHPVQGVSTRGGV